MNESVAQDKEELENVLRKYTDKYAKFKNVCGLVDDKYAHEIRRIPKPQRQYFINKKAEAKIDLIIKVLEKLGIISKVEYAPTNAPIQAVPKPDGTWRLVTNYKALKKVTVTDTKYLINAQDTLTSPEQGVFFVQNRLS